MVGLASIKRALIGVDAYIATPTMKPLIKVMDEAGVKHFIAMSVSDVQQEVAGSFQA